MFSTFPFSTDFFFSGKGGKGDKGGNGGKSPEKKTPPAVQLRVEKGKYILQVML